MSIKIAVLKSGEDVIADMKEIRKEDSGYRGRIITNIQKTRLPISTFFVLR